METDESYYDSDEVVRNTAASSSESFDDCESSDARDYSGKLGGFRNNGPMDRVSFEYSGKASETESGSENADSDYEPNEDNDYESSADNSSDEFSSTSVPDDPDGSGPESCSGSGPESEAESLSDSEDRSSESEADDNEVHGQKRLKQFSGKLSTVAIPAKSDIYATVFVNRNGCGRIPQMRLANDQVILMSSVCDAKDGTAKVPFMNVSDKNIELTVPVIQLSYWDPDWDNLEKKNKVSCANAHASKKLTSLKEKFNFNHLNVFLSTATSRKRIRHSSMRSFSRKL